MFVLAIAVFVICPILVLPFLIIGLKKDKKYKKIYLAIIAVFMALFSYCYIPTQTEDLYRHNLEVAHYENMEPSALLEKISSSPEQASLIYKYLISKTGNPNLLQFFTSVVCFYILLFLLAEYSEIYDGVRGWKLISIWMFVLSVFYFIAITSNIFFTLAIEIFALAIYSDYVWHKKIASILLYVFPIFIHTALVLPLIVVTLYKLLGSKNGFRNIFIIAAIILSIGPILAFFSSMVDVSIVAEVSNLYNAYFNNEEEWSNLRSFGILALHFSKMLPIIIAYVLSKKRDSISDLAVLICAIVVALFFQTSFSVRYINLAVLCSIPIFFETARNDRYGMIFCLSLYGFSIPHFIFQIRQFSELGEIKGIERIIITDLFTTLSGGLL